MEVGIADILQFFSSRSVKHRHRMLVEHGWTGSWIPISVWSPPCHVAYEFLTRLSSGSHPRVRSHRPPRASMTWSIPRSVPVWSFQHCSGDKSDSPPKKDCIQSLGCQGFLLGKIKWINVIAFSCILAILVVHADLNCPKTSRVCLNMSYTWLYPWNGNFESNYYSYYHSHNTSDIIVWWWLLLWWWWLLLWWWWWWWTIFFPKRKPDQATGPMRQERGRSTSRKFLDSAAGDCFLVNPPIHENHAQWENIREIDLIYGGRRREPGFRIVGECVSRPLLWGLKILTMIHHFLHETWRYLPCSGSNRRKPVDGSVSILDC